MNDRPPKHFLDTSVVRKLLGGAKSYRDYLNGELAKDAQYVSTYVRMEFHRGLIEPLICFYQTFALDGVETVLDAKSVWSERFEPRDVKTILEFADQVTTTRGLNPDNPRDTAAFVDALGDLIIRYSKILDVRFKQIGENSTGCTRGVVPLNIDFSDLADAFNRYQAAFSDVKRCRSLCHVDDYVLRKQAGGVEQTVGQAENYRKDRNASGFLKVADKLADLREKGALGFTCRSCATIGDAIIAFEMPRDMELQHLDRSFNYLCDINGIPHRILISQTQFIKDLNSAREQGKPEAK